MKRKNDDEDLPPKKRVNLEELNGLLTKATEAYNSQYMSSCLSWGNMAYVSSIFVMCNMNHSLLRH